MSDLEKEWRQNLMQEIHIIKKEQREILVAVTTLKVKIGIVGGFFGMLSGLVTALITSAVNKHI